MSRWWNCCGEKLTATLTPAGHFMHSMQALRRIQRPRSTIRPMSSATGMMSIGDTVPRTG